MYGAVGLLLISVATASALSSIAPFTPPDALLNKISIGSDDLTAQSLPLSMCSTWPVWIAAPGGGSVTLLPSDGEESGWVNPATFEQLWLPLDLPAPQCRASIGAVLKDGVPRYLFPCFEATITTVGGALDGQVWHNRGLNTLPLAKTWLPFGDVPTDSLRISGYRKPLPPPPPEGEEAGGDADADANAATGEDEDEASSEADWTPVLPLTEVNSALESLFDIVANGPDELGSGFCFLVAPLDDSLLPASAIEPGQRLRLFLSDVDATPTALDPDDRESWVWKRGEADLSLYSVAAGGESEFLPEVYKPLYKAN